MLLAVYWESEKRECGWFSLWIEYCSLCSGRVGRVTGVSLVSGFDIAGCVLEDWEERQGLVLFVDWILLSV
jgi:hypothetical protein